jgi:hypothetical protein
MRIDLVGTSWTGSMSSVNPVTRALTSVGPFTAGTLNGALTASDFGTLQVDWTMASGDTNAPGTLGLVVNELTIRSVGDPVPEPSTGALAAVGLLMCGAAATIFYRRRKAAKETATP